MHQHVCVLAAVLAVHDDAVRGRSRLLPVVGQLSRQQLVPRQLPHKAAGWNGINLQQYSTAHNTMAPCVEGYRNITMNFIQ
jgi:hypothetical protein